MYRVWFINPKGTVVIDAEYNSKRVAELKKVELERNRKKHNVGSKVWVTEVEVKNGKKE